ncbi:VID27-domain-containing protein [Atractiella rhizophila]|nr:VID27-domain-containing protein [Atractiella rhizophila]
MACEAEESEEEEDEPEPVPGEKNANLEIGYKDRTFVTRGNMVGVFSNDNEGKKLQFVTNIANIRDKKNRAILPDKVMLHQQDTNLILKDPLRPDTLYMLDLETGKIADEMRVSEDMIVKTFAPNAKFAQQDPEQTFTGLSSNTIFRVDPRLGGDRIVGAESKTYSGKPLFSSVATTGAGGIALASEKGEIKLFDRLGIRAKTALPGSGEPITAVDVSADGKYLVVTGKDHLLFIDTTIREGKNKDESGFNKSFPADAKPKPIRLKLKPEHRLMMGGDSVSFTPAKFNTGKDLKESSIVTSTGPFVLTWNVRRVINGHTEYRISKFNDNVVAENFRFGGDKEIIVTLPSQVLKAQSSTFTQPTTEALTRRSGRRGEGIVKKWS